MSAAEVIDPGQELQERAVSLVAQAQDIRVIDQSSYDRACDFLLGVGALRKTIVEHHAPVKKRTHEAHKEACAMEQRQLTPVTMAETIIKRSILIYEQEQKRLQEERDQKAREEAELARAEMIEAAAVAAEAEGATAEEVEAIITQPVIAPPVSAPKTFQRASNILLAQTWKAEVFDMKALAKAVAEGKAPVSAIEPNMTALNQMARAMKSGFNLPGVRAVPFDSLRAGGR